MTTEKEILKKTDEELLKFGKGLKFDQGKLRWDLLPWQPTEQVVKIMTYGANKYGENNWQNIDIERYWGALFRHLIAFRKGEEDDGESGLSHISHALCNLTFIYWILYHHEDSDKKQIIKEGNGLKVIEKELYRDA